MDLLYRLWNYLPFQQFMNPDKRIYWPYLLICVFYAFLFYIFSKTKIKNLGVSYWLHPSAIKDYLIWVLNHFLQVTLLPLVFISGLSLSGKFYHLLTVILGPSGFEKSVSLWVIIGYTVTFIVISDFSRYILHYLMHHNRFFWSIHQLHHSAEVLTPITLFRVHPLEMILFQLRYLVVYALVTGTFLYAYADILALPRLFGASCIVFISNVLGANLRHSHFPIGFWGFERVFISPKQHQMHHSKETVMQKSNLGSFLAIWDILFSSWLPSKNITSIHFGLKNHKKQSFIDELVLPLKALKFSIKKKSHSYSSKS